MEGKTKQKETKERGFNALWAFMEITHLFMPLSRYLRFAKVYRGRENLRRVREGIWRVWQKSSGSDKDFYTDYPLLPSLPPRKIDYEGKESECIPWSKERMWTSNKKKRMLVEESLLHSNQVHSHKFITDRTNLGSPDEASLSGIWKNSLQRKGSHYPVFLWSKADAFIRKPLQS